MMSHATMTYKQVLEAHAALKVMSSRGYRSQKASKKVARMFIWAKAKVEEYNEDRKLLIAGLALKEDNGNAVPDRRKNEETGVWEDVPGSVKFAEPSVAQETLMELLEETVSTNGIQFTDKDLGSCNTKPEPAIYIGLGPLFDWGD